ncbi:LuxR C-terminal-related transcriptional regulator [Amycolatopsis cynarae]|uniref:LuxR C-terminal-related transcriptional regulator n=1 Tax=Amycolatopsis cynarae TaxID=2995223 RepID=A0ABY7AV94_9PSEU|nr:LuxR C-terminal-related transcriptional regulator [Amycolatopsis sp. HUAS 11-8]WAL63896.1 LuxR C-terminal-related transcriptional regulator [Amycolatopsis sp. HUAS 11-8]
MAEPPGIRPLAGLVSPAAEALFLRLTRNPAEQPGSGDQRALNELLGLGLLRRHGDRVRGAGQAAALRSVLERRQREVFEAQQRILDGWSRLAALLPAAGEPGEPDGVDTLTGHAEVHAHAAELAASAKHRLRATGSLLDAAGWTARPVLPEIRLLVESEEAESAFPAGEVRLRPSVPVSLLHADDSVALIALEKSADTALLVWAPGLLAVFACWFDLLWDDPATIRPEAGPRGELTGFQRRVLELMATGGDETIARRLKVSTTTVRRHIKVIYTALGVDNRFAAGVAAVRRGWL